eukprot:Rmarinus@m.24271
MDGKLKVIIRNPNAKDKNQKKSDRDNKKNKNKRKRHEVSGFSTEEEENSADDVNTKSSKAPAGGGGGAAKDPAVGFWETSVGPYFAPIGQKELDMIAVRNLKRTDEIFEIPPLGKPQGTANGITAPPRTAKAKRNLKDGSEKDDTGYVLEESSVMHRLLAALIEEKPATLNDIVDSARALLLESKSDAGSDTSSKTQGGKSEPPKKKRRTTQDTAEGSDQEEIEEYEPPNMPNLSDRAFLELQAIDLMDEAEIDPSNRQDDELCVELRKKVTQLERVNRENNERRGRLLRVVQAWRTWDEKRTKELDTLKEAERQYLRKKNARKKRRKPKKSRNPSGARAKEDSGETVENRHSATKFKAENQENVQPDGS